MRNRFLFVVLPMTCICFSRGSQLDRIESLLFAIFSALVIIAIKVDHVEEKKKEVDWVRLLTVICFMCIIVGTCLGLHRELWLIVTPIVLIISFMGDIIRGPNKENKE